MICLLKDPCFPGENPEYKSIFRKTRIEAKNHGTCMPRKGEKEWVFLTV